MAMDPPIQHQASPPKSGHGSAMARSMAEQYYETIYRRDYKGLRGCRATTWNADRQDIFSYDACLYKPEIAPDAAQCCGNAVEVIDAAMKDRYKTVSQVDYTPGKLEILKRPIGIKPLDTSFLLIQATARDTYNAHCKKAVRPLVTSRRLYGFYDDKLWHTGETEYDGVIGRTGWEMLKSGYKNDTETTPIADNELATIMH